MEKKSIDTPQANQEQRKLRKQWKIKPTVIPVIRERMLYEEGKRRPSITIICVPMEEKKHGIGYFSTI